MTAAVGAAQNIELSLEAAAAYDALMLRLIDTADAGYVTPCRVVGWAFLSEDPDDRDAAARACLECPAMVACARFALANDERFGVWGGVDCTTIRGLGRRRARAVLERITGGAR